MDLEFIDVRLILKVDKLAVPYGLEYEALFLTVKSYRILSKKDKTTRI
ncbi:hypothetical protein [Flavobacterium sandaracinum]|nr:hypothetical protein [Flavobacterium sandaracinum]